MEEFKKWYGLPNVPDPIDGTNISIVKLSHGIRA